MERHWDTTSSARQCHHRHPQRGGKTLQNQTKSEQVRFWNLGGSTSHQHTAPVYRPDTPVHWNSVTESSRSLPTQQQLLQLLPAFPEPGFVRMEFPDRAGDRRILTCPQWPSPLPLLYQESLSTRSIHLGTPLPLSTGITDFQCTQGLTQRLQPSSEPSHHTQSLKQTKAGTTRGSQCLEGFLLCLPVLLAVPQRGFLSFQSQQPILEAASSQTSHLERDFS